MRTGGGPSGTIVLNNVDHMISQIIGSQVSRLPSELDSHSRYVSEESPNTELMKSTLEEPLAILNINNAEPSTSV